MQTHLIPGVHTFSVDFAYDLLATVATCFPTWHSSMHVLNKWLKVEICQLLTLSGPQMLSTKAESIFCVTIIDNFTLETYLCYSNIIRTGKSIHSLLHQQQSQNACVNGIW